MVKKYIMFDFVLIMANKSDVELLQIIGDADKYQNEAVVAAKNELSKRSLTQIEIDAATRIYLNNKDADDVRANTPLDNHWKLLTLVFPAILTIILSGHLKGTGYDRKAKELVTWTFYGFALYAIIIFLTHLF